MSVGSDGVEATVGRRAATTGGTSAIAHVDALDGLRGLAVAAVLAFHAGFGWASGGFLGVSTFFTLSGFLVGSLLLAELIDTGRLDAAAFFSRRLRRLLPAGLAGVLLCLGVGAALHLPPQPGDLRWDAISSSQFWTNWRFVVSERSYADLFTAPSPFTHYWSLAVEAQLYVVAPIVVLGLHRLLRGRRSARAVTVGVLVAAALGSTALCVVGFRTGADNGTVYYGTHTRAAEFLVGMALAAATVATRRRMHGRSRGLPMALVGAAGLAGLGALVVWGSLSEPWVYRGGFLLNAVCSAAVIAASLAGAPVLSPVLAWGPLAHLGRISYGVYLYHWPAFLVLTERRLGWGRWPTLALRLVVSLALAEASVRWIEARPRDRRRVADRVWWRTAPVTLAGVAAVVVVVTAQLPSPPAAATSRASGPNLTRARPTVTTDPAVPDPTAAPTTTVFDPSADGFRVLVVGDADGVVFGERLRAWAASTGGYEVMAPQSWGCAAAPCDPWSQRWVEGARADRADLVLFSVNSFDDAALSNGLGGPLPADGLRDDLTRRFTDLFTSVQAAGVAVAWLPVPEASGNDLRKRLDPRVDAVFRSLDAATGASGARKVSLETQYNDLLREKGRPSDHIAAAAELAGPRIAAVLQSLVPGVPRVMVVGDSVARTLGAGLEAWGASGGGVAVWDVSRDGCGILLDGVVQGLYAGLGPLPPDCATAAADLPAQLAEFRPTAVIVLSTIWDLADRRLDGWPRPEHPGDPQFDAYLLDRYGAFVDGAHAAGATVVWLTVPCADPTHGGLPFGTPRTRTAFEASRRRHVNEVLLPQLVASRPGAVRLADLDGAVCPGGRFREQVGPVRDGRPDGLHFSDAAARWLAATYAPGWLSG